MNARIRISILLISLGLIAAIVPFKHNKPGQLTPQESIQKAQDEQYMIPVDKVARFVVDEDTSVLIIDLRSPKEFKAFNIPGSINIPYKDLLHKDYGGYIDQQKVKNIFYSNGDILSTMAWTLCTSMGYENNYVMQGGLNEWFKTVMNSEFKGDRISARENALFETRYKARRLSGKINSLPDSLRIKFTEIKRKKERQLDGGCE